MSKNIVGSILNTELDIALCQRRISSSNLHTTSNCMHACACSRPCASVWCTGWPLTASRACECEWIECHSVPRAHDGACDNTGTTTTETTEERREADALSVCLPACLPVPTLDACTSRVQHQDPRYPYMIPIQAYGCL